MNHRHPLLLTSALALALALSACSPSPPPASPEVEKDPPVPTPPIEVPAAALEQARQANQVFITLHAKPGQPALKETLAQGDRWVALPGEALTVCIENANSTPVLVGLAIQGKDLAEQPAVPGGLPLVEVVKGRVVCPASEWKVTGGAPLTVSWVVYPTNGQDVEELTKDGRLKDAQLSPGGSGLIRWGELPTSAEATRPEAWPGHPEATPPPMSPTEQAALQQVLQQRDAEAQERWSRPKPDHVEAS